MATTSHGQEFSNYVIPLLQTKTADTAHMKFLELLPGLFLILGTGQGMHEANTEEGQLVAIVTILLYRRFHSLSHAAQTHISW